MGDDLKNHYLEKIVEMFPILIIIAILCVGFYMSYHS